MTTQSSPLSAAQVCAAVFEQTQLSISVAQLGRWAHAGLLPAPQRTGTRGMRGITWSWDPVCVPQAALIARTLAHGRGTLQEAAHVLAVKGYAPRPDILKQVLVAYLAGIERGVQSNRPFMKAGLTRRDKRQRLDESLRRRNKAMPLPLQDIGVKAATSVAGLANPAAQDPYSQAQPYLSVASLQHALGELDSAALLQAYDEGSSLITGTMPLLEIIAEAAKPANAQGTLTSTFTEVLPSEIALTFADHFRLLGVLTMVGVHAYGMPESVSAEQLLDVWTPLFSERGVSFSP
jgi:hypothetical protein